MAKREIATTRRDVDRAVDVTRAIAEDLRRRREDHEAAVQSRLPTMNVMRRRVNEKGRIEDLVKTLALLDCLHREFGPDDDMVPVPRDVLYAVAVKLVGKWRWQEAQTQTGRSKGEKARSRDQVAAEEIWRRHPNWSKQQVGAEIARMRGDGANPDTIRRRIKKVGSAVRQ
jgi:hypothetical protein